MCRVPTMTRRRLIVAIAVVAFLVGLALLYLQSRHAKERLVAARTTLKGDARRYTAAIVHALHAGPLTGRQLLDLRTSAYRHGARVTQTGVTQSIDQVGGRNHPGGVTVTFKVQAGFKGTFNTSASTSSCFRATVHHGTKASSDPPPTIDCAALLPDIAPTAILALPGS